MITTWGTVWQCDRCRAMSPLFMSPDADKQGWTHFSMPLVRPDGVVYNELGPECMRLTFAELMRSPDGDNS